MRTCSSIMRWRSGLGSAYQARVLMNGYTKRYFAELELGRSLALGSQSPPGGIQLIEGVANDLAFFGRRRGSHERNLTKVLLAALPAICLDHEVGQPTKDPQREHHHHQRAQEIDQIDVLIHRPMNRRRWRR